MTTGSGNAVRELGAVTLAYLAAFDRLWAAETELDRDRARLELERLLPWLLAEAGAEHLYDRARRRARGARVQTLTVRLTK